MLKLRLTKYIIVVLITTFLSVFFILVNKTYLGIKETQEKVLNIPQAKPIDPKLDTDFLDLLESQDFFKPQDMDVLINTIPTLVPTPTP